MTRFANLTPNANRTIWVLLPKVISPCLTRVYDRCKRLVVITPTNCPVSHTNHFRQSVSQFRRLQYLIKKSIYRLWSGLALARLFYVCLFYVCLFYARLFYVCLFYVCLFYVCLFDACLFPIWPILSETFENSRGWPVQAGVSVVYRIIVPRRVQTPMA